MSYWLTSIPYFIVQFLPCALLCSLPFSDSEFKFSRKIWLGAVVSWLVFNSIGHATAVTALRERGQALYLVVHNLYGMYVVLTCAVFFILTVRAHLYKKLLVFFQVLCYEIFVGMLINFIGTHLEERMTIPGDFYYPYTMLSLTAVTAVSLPFVWWFMKKPVRRYLCGVEPAQLKRAFGFVFVLAVLYGVVMVACSMQDEPYFMDSVNLVMFLFCTVSLILTNWFLFCEIQNERERSAYKAQLQIQQIQYQKILHEMENTRRTRHDIRHHLHLLESLLAEGRCDEAKDYLKTSAAFNGTAGQRQFCTDPLINALLQYYAEEAEQKEIAFTAEVSLRSCPIDPVDMTVVLGNCLENAINACQQVENGRSIHLLIGQVNSTLAFQMENSCESVCFSRSEKQGSGYQRAEAFLSAAGEGIGLASVAQTAEKYGGTAEFKYQRPLFYTRVNFDF